MRVGCLQGGRLAGMGGITRGTRCSPRALPHRVRSGGGWGLWDPKGLGLEKGHSQSHFLFPLEIHRAHEEDPHYHPVHHIQRCQVHRCLQQGVLLTTLLAGVDPSPRRSLPNPPELPAVSAALFIPLYSYPLGQGLAAQLPHVLIPGPALVTGAPGLPQHGFHQPSYLLPGP